MNNLEKVLAEYHKYLMLRKLAKADHVPYLVSWVREFLQFAKDKTGHKFQAGIEMFKQHLEQNPEIKDWQIRHPQVEVLAGGPYTRSRGSARALSLSLVV